MHFFLMMLLGVCHLFERTNKKNGL